VIKFEVGSGDKARAYHVSKRILWSADGESKSLSD